MQSGGGEGRAGREGFVKLYRGAVGYFVVNFVGLDIAKVKVNCSSLLYLKIQFDMVDSFGSNSFL